MRIGAVVLIVWLIIGAIAGGQRHYYNGSDRRTYNTRHHEATSCEL
jgi:hypothetical protein